MSAYPGSLQSAVAKSQHGWPQTGRLALFAGGCLSAVVIAGVLAHGSAVESHGPMADPAFVRLLRGMALLKGAVALAAVAAAGWRLTGPIGSGAAIGYGLGACSMASATVLMWELTMLPLAAVLFHTGLLTVLVFAWRDDRRPWRAARANRRSA